MSQWINTRLNSPYISSTAVCHSAPMHTHSGGLVYTCSDTRCQIFYQMASTAVSLHFEVRFCSCSMCQDVMWVCESSISLFAMRQNHMHSFLSLDNVILISCMTQRAGGHGQFPALRRWVLITGYAHLPIINPDALWPTSQYFKFYSDWWQTITSGQTQGG